jgi:hypothetical protein
MIRNRICNFFGIVILPTEYSYEFMQREKNKFV